MVKPQTGERQAGRPQPHIRQTRARQTGSRQTGTVKWFDVEKGYGFIERKQGKDLFVHESDIRGRNVRVLHEGQVVEFAVRATSRGLKAADVTTPWYT